MKISSKGEYGLRALFDLTQHFEARPRRSREIAEAQNIAEDYLNQLLIILRKAGLINSLRGPQGGHILAKPPHQISLFDAVFVLEGPLTPVDYSNELRGVKAALVDEILHPIWDEVERETIRILQGVTLKDLVERTNARQATSMYYI